MQIHHDKHHQTYITKLQTAISQAPTLKGKSLVSSQKLEHLRKAALGESTREGTQRAESCLPSVWCLPTWLHIPGVHAADRIACMQDDLNKAVGTRDIPSDVTTAVRNNGGGHWNHSFFWKILTPAESKEADYQVVASDELKKGIEEVWGSLNAFQAKFNEAATAVFGSGWAWLGVDDSGTLVISTTSKIVCSSTNWCTLQISCKSLHMLQMLTLLSGLKSTAHLKACAHSRSLFSDVHSMDSMLVCIQAMLIVEAMYMSAPHSFLPTAASSTTSSSYSLLCATTQQLRRDAFNANAQMSSQMHSSSPETSFHSCV